MPQSTMVAEQLLTAACMMLDPRRDSLHESVFEGSQSEGAGGGRSWDAKGGGRGDLRDLPALDQTLAKEAKRNGRGRRQSPARSPGRQRDDARRVVARSSSEQSRSEPRGTLRGFRAGLRSEGIGGHHEPSHLAPSGRLAAQKKSPLASERDEQARGLWRWLASRFDAGRLVFVEESGFHTSMTRL
jgi:hypothetical protein